MTVHEQWSQVAGALELMDVHRNLLPILAERFEAGAHEHGDDWGTWPLERFAAEVVEEQLDILLYTAMATVVIGQAAITEIGREVAGLMSGEVD